MTIPIKNVGQVGNLSHMHILAIDLGTSYFKGCLFDQRGRIVARVQRPLAKQAPLPGHCELNPEWFRRTIAEVIAELGSTADGLADVAAVTFATQTNSFLLLDQNERPLTPIILWPDERARPMADETSRLLDGLALRATTGVPEIGHQFMAAKLLWLRSKSAEVWSLARRLCLISDYLTLWMTGRHATEAGAAGLTGLLDVHRLQWWPDACRRFGIPQAWLPECVRAGTDLGPIRAEVADALGLPRRCRFVAGCLDQYAGAIGAGNITPGGVSETTGTVLATVRCADRFDASLPPSVFQGPGFNAGIVFQMVFGNFSANILEAYRNSLPDRPDFDDLVGEAAEIAPGADGLRFDRLSEEPGGAPMFHGLTDRHGRGHKVRAILEAVSFALAGQVEQLCGGHRPTEIRSVGGAARSAFWRQLKADVLDCPVASSSCPEPTSLGAAMLAAVALGLGEPEEIVSAWARAGPPAYPDPRRHAVYRDLLPVVRHY